MPAPTNKQSRIPPTPRSDTRSAPRPLRYGTELHIGRRGRSTLPTLSATVRESIDRFSTGLAHGYRVPRRLPASGNGRFPYIKRTDELLDQPGSPVGPSPSRPAGGGARWIDRHAGFASGPASEALLQFKVPELVDGACLSQNPPPAGVGEKVHQ